MRSYVRHLFVCEGSRCSSRGSGEILEMFKRMAKKGELEGVRLSRCGCLKVCKETETEGEYSPVLVVYPEGVWYRNVSASDVAEIAEVHLRGGRVVERLLHYSLGRPT